MNDMDRAQARDALDTDLALKAHQAKARLSVVPLPKLVDAETGEELCVNCTESLEPERLARNPDIRLCLPCQAMLDKHRARRGHYR